MKIVKSLLPLFLVLCILLCGCSSVDKTDVEAVITSELDLLKNLDSDTTMKYISYKELFPEATENTELSAEVKEVFSLFFQDFDYKILNIDVDKKEKTAAAALRLSTLDARTLAKDYAELYLTDEITAAASSSENTKENTNSLEKRYLLLNQLLKDNTYETVENNCTMNLQDVGTSEEEWEIKRTYSLENSLVGGLMTYLSDPDILSPENTLNVYLKTLKSMDLQEMSNYLGVESILNTSDTAKNAIATALVEQVHNIFNYEIKACTTEGYNATIETEITTFDSDAIVASYEKKLEEYLASPDAVIDGAENRYQKSHDLLLENIQNNQASKTAAATFHLLNDGVSWKLEDDSTELGNAIFGTLVSSPVDTGTAEAPTEDPDTAEEASGEDVDSGEDYSDGSLEEDYSEESYSEEDYSDDSSETDFTDSSAEE